jgi:hypothetical protein
MGVFGPLAFPLAPSSPTWGEEGGVVPPHLPPGPVRSHQRELRPTAMAHAQLVARTPFRSAEA